MMKTKFEKDFLLGCLNKINTVLSSPKEIERAVLIFSQTDENDPRYQLQSYITDAENWSKKDKIVLSAAVFEAIAHNSFKFCKNEEDTEALHDATELFKERYLSLISADTEPDNRLISVRKNIVQIKFDIEQESQYLHTNKPIISSARNNQSFFSNAAMMGVGITVVVAGLALLR